LSGTPKESACEQYLEELQANIRHKISDISALQIWRVSRNAFLLRKECLEAEFRHFKTFLLE
jgi:hypothetical protein